MKKILFGLIVLISTSLTAQTSFFSPRVYKASDSFGKTQKIMPTAATYYSVANPLQLADFLRAVPGEEQATNSAKSLLRLPAPDGTISTFRLTRYQIISDEMQALYPHYVTAYGWDVDAPNRKIYLEWTDLGFGASVTGGAEGRWYISPQFHQDQALYQAYYTRDYPTPDYDAHCAFEPDAELQAELEAFGPPALKSVGDCQLREYDLALACTGEYYAAVGGTDQLVFAEMMTAINRVNQVFRSDLAITLKIINQPLPGGGIELLYSNPASDPYTNNSGGTMLGENQATVDAVIGSANYDIGHVFSTGGGGIASLGSPCTANNKARGVTGLANPTGDPFYIDFVAHEIGHQFGGNHTFNSTNGNCAARNGSTAYEPGSGTTIQAYAGICGTAGDFSANVQLNSDPYYHAVSIQEISAYMEFGGGSTCASVLSTANSAPAVSAGSNYTIPANTPFVLTATGSDGDGDALTYCWEQFDLGPVEPAEPSGTLSSGPLFRSLPPTSSPQRYFPNLPDLVASGSAPWEVLPQVARDMSFIVTIRDNGAAGYGCTVQDQTDITVVASAGFAVNAPNGGEVWNSGQSETVSWDVAGTGNGTAVDCEMVDVVLSTDGGITFDQLLATVPNTGTAVITAPAITETDARIMIRCNGNIFFDVGDADFSIEQTDYNYTVTAGTATACNGAAGADFTFELESLQGYTGTISYTALNLPAGAGSAFNPASATLAAGASQAVTLTVNNLSGITPGEYTFQVETDDGVSIKSEDFVLTIQDPLSAPVLLSPADGGFLSRSAAVFDWSDVPNATEYDVQVCLDAAANNCFFPNTTTNSGINYGTSFENMVNDGDQAWWRVTARNTNCDPDEEVTTPLSVFTWGEAPPMGASLSNNSGPISVCEGNTTEEEFDVVFFDGDLIGPATLSVTSAPAGLSTMVTPSTLSNGQSAAVSFTGEETLAPGEYTITVQADDGSTTEDIDLTLSVTEDGLLISSPADGEQFMLQANAQCTSFNQEGAIFVSFVFDAPTGVTVTEYRLRVSIRDFEFNPSTVTPGQMNPRGYCATDGDVFEYVIEADLQGGGMLVSCPRTFIAATTALPVDWLSFTARPLGKTSQLNWSVVQDEAHAGFTVERSTNASGGWEDIARVERVGGNGEADYALNDATVNAGTTYFYRLRQEDADGTTDYSPVESVTFAAESGLSVFPNPVSGQLTVTMGEADLTYRLYDALGKVVLQGKLAGGRGLLDLTNLPSAVYQLVVGDGAVVREVSRVVKR